MTLGNYVITPFNNINIKLWIFYPFCPKFFYMQNNDDLNLTKYLITN